MARAWQEVKDNIEHEIDRIIWDEPLEVKMTRLGVFPSGAGTDGQNLGNFFFIAGDMQVIGWWTSPPAMKQAIADPDLDVEACKKYWKYMNMHMLQLMGDISEPNCPAPWLNLGRMTELGYQVADAFESIKTKRELESLLWSWFNYTERLYRWFYLVFPWHLADQVPLKSEAEVRELVRSGELPDKILDEPANWKVGRV